MSALRQKTVKALSWSLAQEAAQRLAQLTIGVVLARLLAPEAFGLVAMLTVFLAIADVLLA